MTARDLETQAGAPKAVKILGRTIFKRSTGFRDILAKMDAYHACLGSKFDLTKAGGREAFGKTLGQAIDQLKQLKISGQRYTADPDHTRTKHIQALMSKVDEELQALERLSGDLKSIPDGPLGNPHTLSLGDAMEFSRSGALPAEILQKTERRQIEGFTAIGCRREEATLLTRAGLTVDIALAMAEMGIPITPETVDIELRPETQAGPMNRLGSGSFNSTATVQIKGKPGVFVFKPVPRTDNGWVSLYSGIDSNNPRTAQRNLATCRIARALGFNVVSPTKLGYGTPPPPPPNRTPVLGLVMEKAKGTPGWKMNVTALDSPKLRQQLLRLQLLDHLTGQGDRHAGNYFVHRNADGSMEVRGIDNDQCLGQNLTEPSDIRYVAGHDMYDGFRGTDLPPLVDKETAELFNALTSEQLRTILSELKFSPREINAAIKRHAGLKSRLAELKRAGRIVEIADLSRDEFKHMFTSGNSYIGRDLRRQAAF